MAGNSIIGALRVDLGLNSAQFVKGMKDASGGLKIFGVQLTYSLNGIAEQVGRLIGAFPAAIKGAIDHADALSKAAQKAGVTVEALSRLEYAAKFSDVSLEDLTGSLGKLSKSMAEAVATPTSTAATAFKALGISVTDAAGKLRPANEVFSQIADRFSRLEDGSTKTALAMQLFGKSGAQLIPLLNSGATGLKQMADESDRLGTTVGTKTAHAAEKFNDTLTKIGEIMGGVVNQVMEAALPALQQLADTLASPEFASAAKQLATWVISSMNAIAQAVTGTINLVGGLINKIQSAYSYATSGASGRSTAQLQTDANDYRTMLSGGRQLADREGTIKKLMDTERELADRLSADLHPDNLSTGPSTFDFRSVLDQSGGSGGSGTGGPFAIPSFDTSKAVASLKPLTSAISETTDKVGALAQSIGDTLSGAVTGFIGAIEHGTSPLQAFADELGNIGNQLLNAGIQSIISSIFSPVPSFAPGMGFAGLAHRAMGGPVSLGQPYMVGENGPELFTPGVSGSITPNSALGGGQSVVRVELGPELVGQVLKQAANQTVQIVKSNAPAAVTRSQLDHRRGG